MMDDIDDLPEFHLMRNRLRFRPLQRKTPFLIHPHVKGPSGLLSVQPGVDIKGGGPAFGNGGGYQRRAGGAFPGREQTGQRRRAVNSLHATARGSFHSGLSLQQIQIRRQAAGANDDIGLHAQFAAGHEFGMQGARLVKREGRYGIRSHGAHHPLAAFKGGGQMPGMQRDGFVIRLLHFGL